MLSAHNIYRKQHRVGPLSQSVSVGVTAQNWAIYLANKNLFVHSSSASDLVENLAASSASSAPSLAKCSGF